MVDGVSLTAGRGRILAIVGESGCGKSLTALSILRLLPKAARIADGTIELEGTDLAHLAEKDLEDIRGNQASIIFQEPIASLNPLMRVGAQVEEALRLHRGLSHAEAQREAIAMLASVGIPDPQRRARQYPFELSGGMCQRVMIAAALICRPRLLIADEPTTALDVTIQAQILDLMKRLRDDVGTSIIIITHDMGVVAEMADDVAVMYGGRVVERGPVDTIFSAPAHPYTQLLLATVPRLDGASQERVADHRGHRSRRRRMAEGLPISHPLPAGDGRLRRRPPLVPSTRLGMPPRVGIQIGLRTRMTDHHPPQRSRSQGPLPGSRLTRARVVKAVDGVSFDIAAGRTVALVGESGCGKSTTAYAHSRARAGDLRVGSVRGTRHHASRRAGAARARGRDADCVPGPERRAQSEDDDRRQHRGTARHPRRGAGRAAAGASPNCSISWDCPRRTRDRTPNALSGGQRQRVVIARALALSPKLLVLDEPVSALDVSIRSQILNLLMELQQRAWTCPTSSSRMTCRS